MTDQDPTQVYQPPAAPAPPPATPPGTPASPPAPPSGYAPAESPAPSAYVAADAPVATAPVAVAGGGRPGRSRLKWLVAGAVTLLVAGSAAGAALLLTSDAGDPAVLAYAPADSVAYAEMRLDLPGDQAAELAKVMQAFPGFEDQAAFPVKLNELMDQLTGTATDGKVSWSKDIDPWFAGQLAMAVGPLPATADEADARALALLSVKDGATATAWLDGMAAEEGATTTTETYNGTTITVVEPEGDHGMGDAKAGYAVVGPVLAIGDVASIRAAIDTGGRTGLAADEAFAAASATITGDRLGFFWADLETITASAEALAGDTGAMPEMPSFMDDLAVPWIVGAVRAEDGAFVMETRSPHVDAIGPDTASESELPGLVPPTTVMLAAGHEVGATLAELKDLLAQEPDLADAVAQVDDALGIVGGFDAATGWIGEAGIAITRDGDDIAGGIVIVPTDAAAAERLGNQLKAFVQLGGAQAGLAVTDETYGDATITVVDLSALGGMAGAMSGGEVEVPADLRLELAWSITDDVVVLGYGTDFVKAVLDARTGESLATTERFSTALEQAGTAHASLFWLDVSSVREAVEAMAPDEMLGEDYAEVKPYLEAFDSVVSVGIPGETIDSGTVIIRVTGD